MASDLEIEILEQSAPGTYEVQVDSPAGTATGTMQLDARTILDRRRELAASVLASAVTSRSAFTTLEIPVRDVGEKLFGALFSGRVYGRYTASLQESSRRGEPLRVVLRLRAPELAGLPWEAMFDPEDGEYLCQREPLVRYVEAAKPSAPLTATGPLRILGMVASPRDLPTLDAAEERHRLDDALGDLAGQGLVEVAWVESGTWAALQRTLMSGPWHVLHVIGHGGTGPTGGVLALEDETTGNTAEVSAGRFARLLHACRPVPRLVVLNSCSSGESAADDVLSSTAAALVHSGISAAVAMQFAVTDPAALAFSRGFYQALAQNIAVDEAVRLGRIAIDGTSEQTLEWVTPVVYLRTDDTRLFELTSRPQPSVRPAEREDVAREAAKYGLYVQALAAARNEEYDEALALLDSVVTMDPAYRDAAERRQRLRRDQQLARWYAEALAAEERADWEAACHQFAEVVDLAPDYRDAATKLADCQGRMKISSLQDELRLHATAEEWAAVVAVSDELAAVDPAAADPDGLATRAREELTRAQAPAPSFPELNHWLYDQARPRAGHPPLPGAHEEEEENAEEPRQVFPPAAPRQPLLRRLRWIWVGALVLALVSAAFVVRQATQGSTCWNGRSVDAATQCSLPVGQSGLATVFPSMDDSCVTAPNVVDPRIAEQYMCDQGAYLLRVTRFKNGTDPFDWLQERNGGAGSPWSLGGEVVGRTWTRVDSGPSVDRPYKWSAGYRDWPYAVTVAAADRSGLEEGKRAVHAREPDSIGLD